MRRSDGNPIREAEPGGQKLPGLAYLHRPSRLIVLFLAPALLFYLVFYIYPMAKAMFLSFHRGSATSEEFVYVGTENFQKLLLHDSAFWTSLWHNLELVVVAGTVTLVLALALAMALTQTGRGRGFFRVIFLFPNVMPVVAAAILWSFVLNPSFGIVNGLLRQLKLESFCRAWLGEPQTALWAVMVIQIWAAVGFYVVLLYAGILNVPRQYTEAARLDGANGFQVFWHVTLPMLTEILRIAIIYIVIGSANTFALVFLVNEGEPRRHTEVLMTYLYEQAFRNGNFGYACSIGVMTLVFVIGLAATVNLLIRKESVEL